MITPERIQELREQWEVEKFGEVGYQNPEMVQDIVAICDLALANLETQRQLSARTPAIQFDAVLAWLRGTWQDEPVAALPAVPQDGQEPLTFDAFRRANVTRCLKWHPAGIQSWSPSDWITAVMGELGELASLLKMRNRERDGLPGNKFSPTDRQIADELADVQTYLDLLAEALGVNLGAATVAKFNEVSERVGFPDRIAASPQALTPLTCDCGAFYDQLLHQPNCSSAQARTPPVGHIACDCSARTGSAGCEECRGTGWRPASGPAEPTR